MLLYLEERMACRL